jgi:drug/metabolite transporter (DMT)-like permease
MTRNSIATQKKTYIAYALLIMTTMFWAGNIVVGKGLRDEISPLSLAFLRWASASLIVLPLSLSSLRKDWRDIVNGWRILLLLSLLGISLFNTILYFSAHSTAATNIALIQTTMPVFVVMLSYVLFAQAITRGMLVGVILAVSGAAFVILKGQLLTLRLLHFAVGDLSMVFAAFIYALYSVLLPKAPRLHPLSFLAVTFVLGTLILLPFFVWERTLLPPIVFSPKLNLLIVYVAVFPSILAYLFWNHGVAVIGSNTTGLFACFIPVFTPVIASLFLHETLHAYHAVGLVMIILGVVLVHTAKSHRRNRAEATAEEKTKPRV